EVQYPTPTSRPVQRLMVPLASGGPADPVGAVPPPILSEPLCLLIVEPTNKLLGFRVDDVDPCHRSYTSDCGYRGARGRGVTPRPLRRPAWPAPIRARLPRRCIALRRGRSAAPPPGYSGWWPRPGARSSAP